MTFLSSKTPSQVKVKRQPQLKEKILEEPHPPHPCSRNSEHQIFRPVSYTHLTLPTNTVTCRSRWSPYH